MSDEPGLGEPAPVTPPAPAEPPASIVNETGEFIENWPSRLTDETLRENESLKTIKNLEGLAKSYVYTKGMVGKDKIPAPNENSTEAEWEAFHRAGGKPDVAADYNFKRPENVPEEYYSNDLALKAMDLFHKIGLSTKQAQAIFDFNNNNVALQLTANAEAVKTQVTQAQDELITEMGNAFEQKKHLGNFATEKGCDGNEELKARVIAKFGKDPDFFRLMSNLGDKFAEHGDISAAKIPTPGDIDKQIAELTAADAYMNFKNPDHKNMVQRVAKLFQEKAKHTRTG